MISRKRVNILDILFLGWYYILDKTIYSFGNESGSITPKEHSIFITFLFHGINVWTITSFVSTKYFDTQLSLYLSLLQVFLVIAVGYIIYLKRNRAGRVTSHETNISIIVFTVLASLIYVIVSFYLMIVVGDFI